VVAGRILGELGHEGSAGEFMGRKRKDLENGLVQRLYPPATGAPNALKWSPDASGAHRTTT
jgi:hypothetical protein